MRIYKGSIYYVDFEPTIGSEQNGIRPAVVIQNDIGNKYSPTILVAPITSKVDLKPNLPTHIVIKAFDNITHDSIILLEQIRAIDKKRMKSYLCKLNPEQILQIDEAIINAFEIDIDSYMSRKNK